MISSVRTIRLFLLSVACCCDQIVAFTSKDCVATNPRGLHHASTNQPQQLFTYNNSGGEEGFESLVEAATSGAMGVYGGDFAGLAATFNPGDGSFIPIPDYLIPESLREWGQEPKCLEVLVSEDIHEDENDEAHMMKRVTTKILPDTGCSIDNLETMLATDEIDLESQWKSDGDDDGVQDIVGLQYPLGEDKLRVETIFGLEGEYGVDRVRVAIDLIPCQEDFAIQSPMMLTLERRTSSISSGGTIAEGGGLDGRTVFMLLGERLRASTTFVDEPSLTYDYYGNFGDAENDIRLVNLPANLSIAYGWVHGRTSWMLQVSQILQDGSRRVMSREFMIAKDGELDFEMRSWVEDPV
mmetsp:Transcript_8388/g.20096  ORF Transcript_8388/g.20096 Transcript_8388/m.20096 type:complete len:354 (+) Transcript_8388:114-1175(+)